MIVIVIIVILKNIISDVLERVFKGDAKIIKSAITVCLIVPIAILIIVFAFK